MVNKFHNLGIIVLISLTYFIYALILTLVLLLIRWIEIRIFIRKKSYRSFLFSLFPKGLTVAVLSSILFSMGGTYFKDIFYISFMIIIITNILSSIFISYTSKKIELKS